MVNTESCLYLAQELLQLRSLVGLGQALLVCRGELLPRLPQVYQRLTVAALKEFNSLLLPFNQLLQMRRIVALAVNALFPSWC